MPARSEGEALGPGRFVMKDEEAPMPGAPILIRQVLALHLWFQGVAPERGRVALAGPIQREQRYRVEFVSAEGVEGTHRVPLKGAQEQVWLKTERLTIGC